MAAIDNKAHIYTLLVTVIEAMETLTNTGT